MTNLDRAKEMYAMIAKGQMLEAFEKYYDRQVVMEEVGFESTSGKEACRKRVVGFVESIDKLLNHRVAAFATDETGNVTMVETWYDIRYKNGKSRYMAEVAVQRWKDGLVDYEKFYQVVRGMDKE